MFSRRFLLTRLQRRLRSSLILQMLLITGIWLLAEEATRAALLPVPGAIVGMFLLLALLAGKRVSIHTVKKGAAWFLAEMLLFFVPAVLAVLDYPQLFGLLGLKLLAAILLGTVTVMVVTAAVVEVGFRITAGTKEASDAVR